MKNLRRWFAARSKGDRAELIGLMGFFFVFSLGQLGRLELSALGALYLHDLYILIWLCIHWRWIGKVTDQALHWLRRHTLFIVTFVWLLIGMLINQAISPELRPLLLAGRISMYSLFACCVAAIFAKESVLQRLVLIITGNLMIWLGVIQYLFLPDTRFLAVLGWDDHYYRMIGPLFDPNFMGMLIILTAIATVSLARFYKRKWLLLTVAYYSAALALTYSRASFGTAIITTGLLACTPFPLRSWSFWQRVSIVAASMFSFLIMLSVAPKPGGEGVKLMRTSTIIARQSTAVQTYQQMTAPDMLIGNGLFSQPRISSNESEAGVLIPQHAQVPDNLILLLLSGTGIIGTILVIASLLYWIAKLASIETAAAIALGATLAHAQFNNTLFEPFISLYLLLFITNPVSHSLQHLGQSKTYVRKNANSKKT